MSSRFEGESDRKYMTSHRTRSGRVYDLRPPYPPGGDSVYEAWFQR